jgi:hypothetical protein
MYTFYSCSCVGSGQVSVSASLACVFLDPIQLLFCEWNGVLNSQAISCRCGYHKYSKLGFNLNVNYTSGVIMQACLLPPFGLVINN